MTEASKRDSMEAATPDLSSKLENTHLVSVSSGPKDKKERPSLTSLPPSVRKSIYAHLLDTELVNLSLPNVSYTHTIKDGVLQFKASRHPFPVNTALFYVNKQISKEARHYFYSKNLFIRFEIHSPDARHAKTMLEDSGVLFSTASENLLSQSTQHALDIKLVEKTSTQKRAIVIFPAQYLPRLINFLDQAGKASGSWAQSHALSLTVLNTYSFPISRLQGDLLELFRLLTNFGGVKIDSANLLPGYASGLETSIKSSSFTAASFLETVKEIADRADAAREARDWELGVQHAQSGIIALTYAYLTRAEALHSQDEQFTKEMQRLRWRFELGIAKALFKLHQSVTTSSAASKETWQTSSSISASERSKIAADLLLAETSVSQALSLATDSPSPASNPWFQTLPPELIPPNKAAWFTDEERGLTWYACGIVHTALGECLFAAGDLERACQLCPEGKNFADAFRRAREGIDWKVRPGRGIEKAGRLARDS